MSPVYTSIYAALLFIPFERSHEGYTSSRVNSYFFLRRSCDAFFLTFFRNYKYSLTEFFRIVRINVVAMLLIDNIIA